LKVLLDEGVPKVIEQRLKTLSISNVEDMGWRGIKNGASLDLMAGHFQVLITADKNLPFQQNLKRRQVSAIILPANDVPTVVEFLPEIEQALAKIAPDESIELTRA
jgi:hypothetical protein